jgi:hypothetical protein
VLAITLGKAEVERKTRVRVPKLDRVQINAN